MSAKPGQLKAYWSKRERDIMYDWGGDGATSADGHWLNTWLTFVKGVNGKTMVDELKERGFDLTTLTISVSMRPDGRGPRTE